MDINLIMKQNICDGNLILNSWWNLERFIYETNDDDEIYQIYKNVLRDFNELFPEEDIKIEDIIEFSSMDDSLDNQDISIQQKNDEIFTKLFNENDDKNVIRRYIENGINVCKIIRHKDFGDIIYATITNEGNELSIYTLRKYFNTIWE